MTPVDDEIFRELEREMFAAHKGPPDLKAIDRLFAADFVSTNADGQVVNKQEWLNILETGQFAVEEITTADFNVRHYAGTAVVTGVPHISRMERKFGTCGTHRFGQITVVNGSW